MKNGVAESLRMVWKWISSCWWHLSLY